MFIHPLLFLLSLCIITFGAWLLHRFLRHLHRSALRRLANQWQMRYVPADLFHLAGRLGSSFPYPEAADLRVMDLIYATQDDRFRYVFTAEFAPDPLAAHYRERRVMTVCEPREHAPDATLSAPIEAPQRLTVIEQYQHLQSHNWCA